MGVFHGDLDRSAGVQVASSATTSKRRRNDFNDNDYDAAERSSGSPGIDDQEDLLHLNSKRLRCHVCMYVRTLSSIEGAMHACGIEYWKVLPRWVVYHELVLTTNEYMRQVGDPLEKAALKGIEWSYKSDEKAMPKKPAALINATENIFPAHLHRYRLEHI
ncbi:hypothetical protein CsSME_00033060 [Camellia sinensis var. sinensis]